MIDRRRFVAGAGGFAAALTSPAAFAQTTKVSIGYPTSSDFLPALVAKERGFFEKHGIDAAMTRVPLINNIPAAMMSGDLDIGAATPPTFLQAVDGGLDLVLVASAARHRKSLPSKSLVARKDFKYEKPEDLKGTVFALNSRHSNSGMNLPRLLFARLAGGKPFFKSVVETGAHPVSIARVASGELDCASIDCMTYAFFKDHRPEVVASLRVLGETPESPAIPFITSSATPAEEAQRLQAALLRLAADPARRPVLDGLRLRTITMPDPAAYVALLDYERQAAELGYPELA